MDKSHKSIVAISKKRRQYVYQKLGEEIKKKKLSNSDKSRLMKKFWKEAKRRFK